MKYADGRIVKDFLAYLRHFFYTLALVRHMLVGLLLLLLIGAGIIAVVEDLDFGDALYLTAITGLTVGYGDIASTTVSGRILSVLIGLIGLIYFGVIVAVVNSAMRHGVEDKREARKAAEQASKQEAKQEAEHALDSSDTDGKPPGTPPAIPEQT